MYYIAYMIAPAMEGFEIECETLAGAAEYASWLATKVNVRCLAIYDSSGSEVDWGNDHEA